METNQILVKVNCASLVPSKREEEGIDTLSMFSLLLSTPQ